MLNLLKHAHINSKYKETAYFANNATLEDLIKMSLNNVYYMLYFPS